MSLTLRVREAASGAPDSDTSLTVGHGKATIGRGPQNDLVLADPQRVISKQHCVIEWTGDRYRVTDTSTNGVFLNQSEEPIGKDKHAYLKDGDRLRISHYEITAQFRAAAAAAPPRPAIDHESAEQRETLDRMIGLDEGPIGGRSAGRGGPMRDIIPDDSGIWSSPQPERSPAHSGQHISPEKEYFQPPGGGQPSGGGAIPEDWAAEPKAEAKVEPTKRAADLFTDTIPPESEAPEIAAPQAPPAKAKAPAAERAAPRPAPERSGSDRALLDAFFDGAELEDMRLTDEQAEEIMYVMGQIYREVVSGLMELLATRSSIKNEFRLSQTTIQPAQNNPLKFSLGADDAMAALLTRRGRTYVPPVQAIREAVGDVKAHQVAVLAGMQLALSGLLRRFDPTTLEERMRNDRSLANLLGGKKARYWDAFRQMYKDLTVEAEDDFHSLFGKEFNRAYEDQIRKLDKR
jgi:type VI secretion system protein